MYINYQQALTSDQYNVVSKHDGPIFCIAGPGSGKTRTIVYRAAHLIQSGIEPENILITTFTRKAAQENLSRTVGLVGPQAHNIFAGTFHALALQLLRKHYYVLGFDSPFTVLSQGDQRALMRDVRDDVGGTVLVEPDFPNSGDISDFFSATRNGCYDLQESCEIDFPKYVNVLLDIYDTYQERKRQYCVMDYDDILFGFRFVLTEKSGIRTALSNRFQYLMVDEFQDTNPVQYDIVQALTTQHQNVLFVGDDAQSIYAFRGANVQNILTVTEIYPEIQVVRLEENHRSTAPIVALLNHTLSFATEKLEKTLRSVVDYGESPDPLIIGAQDGQKQAQYITAKVQDLLRDGVKASEIAVLYRNSHHSHLVDMALTRARIPFVKRGGVEFTESPHILDVLAFLKVMVNRFDRVAWKRLLMLIPRVGSKTADKLLDRMFAQDDNPLLSSVEECLPWDILETYNGQEAYAEHVRSLGAFISNVGILNHDVFSLVVGFYEPYLQTKFKKDLDFRRHGIQQLREAAEQYESVEEFLDDFATEIPESEGGDKTVTLSTIHSAKGGEWEHVFVIELLEGALPSYKDPDNEEELRLFNVACSRAKIGLYLVYPKFIYTDKGGLQKTVVSRFVERLGC